MLRFLFCVVVRSDDKIFENFRVIRLQEASIDQKPCHCTLSGQRHLHEASTRNAFDLQVLEFGLHFAGQNIDTVSFSNVKISGGGCGILAQNTGAADMANVVVSGAGTGLCNEKGFNFIKGAGDSGW